MCIYSDTRSATATATGNGTEHFGEHVQGCAECSRGTNNNHKGCTHTHTHNDTYGLIIYVKVGSFTARAAQLGQRIVNEEVQSRGKEGQRGGRQTFFGS